MQESLWKLLSFVLMVVLLVIYPTLQMWEMQESIIQIEVTNLASELLDHIRFSQELDFNTYQKFLNRLHLLEASLDLEVSSKLVYWLPVENGSNEQIKQAQLDIGHQELIEKVIELHKTDQSYIFNPGERIQIKVIGTMETKSQKIKALFIGRSVGVSRYYVRLSGLVN